MARQAKALGQKLKLQNKEFEEDEEEGAAGASGRRTKEDGSDKLWGANKRAYYDGDDAEVGVRGGY